MSTDTSSNWWESYREAVKITKDYRVLISLLNDRQDIAQRMVSLEKRKYPGKAESWYLTKLINEIKQEKFMEATSEYYNF